MSTEFGDARIEELRFLSELDRREGMSIPAGQTGKRRDMLAYLISMGYVNEFHLPWTHDDARIMQSASATRFDSTMNFERARDLSRLMGGQEVYPMRISHRGRVRLSELRQELQRGRSRDATGILLDQRHLGTDLQIAIIQVSQSNPLSVAFFDMNGLKAINDSPKFGHQAADEVIKIYFQVVSDMLNSRGDVYRNGGDEVVAVLGNYDSDRAQELIGTVCKALMSQTVRYNGEMLPGLSLSVGIANVTAPAHDAKKLLELAERAMYRAKVSGKTLDPKPSTIAIDGDEKIVNVSVTKQ